MDESRLDLRPARVSEFFKAEIRNRSASACCSMNLSPASSRRILFLVATFVSTSTCFANEACADGQIGVTANITFAENGVGDGANGYTSIAVFRRLMKIVCSSHFALSVSSMESLAMANVPSLRK